MKKECAHTRKLLPKYLHGHLFKLEQIRIERHLRSCVVCYSQYQMLKRTDETRKYLKDITPPEGALQIMKEGVSGLGKFKKLLYRPLWIAGIVMVLAVVGYYLNKPRQLDVEIDNIVKSTPSSTAQPVPAPLTPVARPAVVKAVPVVPIEKPLAVSITIDDDKASMRRINGIMAGHGQLRKYKFTGTVREISGSLTKKELRTFFNRIAPFGKVSYSQKRFASFPSAYKLPFVMTLTIVPRAPEEKAPSSPPVKKLDEGKSPSVQTAQKPGEAVPPSLPATSPTLSTAQ